METKNYPKPPNNEEVDLLKLFKYFGKGISDFFGFFGKIFLAIKNGIVLLLIHFVKKSWWYLGVGVLAIALGFYLDNTKDEIYGGTSTIYANLEATPQIYHNLIRYNRMVRVDKDYKNLAAELGIDIEIAEKLKSFEIYPVNNKYSTVKSYVEFYESLDSISKSETSYDKYVESLELTEFNYQDITITATDKDVFGLLRGKFFKSLVKNAFLEKMEKTTIENENKKLNSISYQINKTDSLINEYLKIRNRISEKDNNLPGGSTNIMMGEGSSQNLLIDESKLINKISELDEEYRKANISKVKNSQIINVLVDLPFKGFEIKEWYTSFKIILPLLFFALTMIIFGVINLRKMLINEDQKRQTNNN